MSRLSYLLLAERHEGLFISIDISARAEEPYISRGPFVSPPNPVDCGVYLHHLLCRREFVTIASTNLEEFCYTVGGWSVIDLFESEAFENM
jgi:hypothetical protein